jgi:hypothetical protein
VTRLATALALLALLAHGGTPLAQAEDTAAAREVTLTLPHPLAAGEIAWLVVELGRLSRGQEIDVNTASGKRLGTISPYGTHIGQAAGTFTLPVPPDAIHDGKITVRLSISGGGAPPRAPAAREVRRVTLTTAGVGHL